MACVHDTDCRYAYSAGDSGSGTFSIFDLRDLDHPVEVDADPKKDGVQPFSSPTAGHKWNFDAAGIGTHTGFDGSSMWDVDSAPPPPAARDHRAGGRGGDADGADGYNDFIHHNSFRPNAAAFKPGAPPALANGNVLLVTEEDYEQTDCAQAGSFQTWHVKRLDGRPGGIVPLDKVELGDLGNFPLPQGAFCSSHWFDYRPGGIVAVGFYGGGTQLIDVRDPKQIRSYGYAHWFASEVWDAMWVPVYDARGEQTGRKSNVVYAIDLVRGIDVYSVDVPGKVGIQPTGAGAPDRTLADVAPQRRPGRPGPRHDWRSPRRTPPEQAPRRVTAAAEARSLLDLMSILERLVGPSGPIRWSRRPPGSPTPRRPAPAASPLLWRPRTTPWSRSPVLQQLPWLLSGCTPVVADRVDRRLLVVGPTCAGAFFTRRVLVFLFDRASARLGSRAAFAFDDVSALDHTTTS